MQVNNVSFKGLWEYKSSNKVGTINVDVRPYKEYVYVGECIYHPFSDENEETIKAEVEKYNNKLIEAKGAYHPSTPTWITLVKAEVGSKLPFCEKMYEQIKKMEPVPYARNKNNWGVYMDKIHPAKEKAVNELLSNC